VSLTRQIVFGRDPRRTVVRVLVLAAISFIMFGWVLIPVRAEGISMLPTFQSGSLHFVSRVAYSYSRPSRGDVIAIRLAGPHVLYVKRIIALPGERVSFVHGQVYVNGAPLIEPYVHNRRMWDVPEVQLTAREYFVVGDNRAMRAADHDFGRVDVSRIVGKLLF
jgi:signal peptidase I